MPKNSMRFGGAGEPNPFGSVLTTGIKGYRRARPYNVFPNKRKKQSSSSGGNEPSAYSAFQDKYAGYTANMTGETTADAVITKATSTLQDEWEDYVKKVYPAMDYLGEQTQTIDLKKGVREDVARTFETRKGTTRRNLSRYGIELTGAEQEQMQRDYQLAETSAQAGGRSQAFVKEKDLREGLTTQLHGLSLKDYQQGMSALTSGGQEAYAKKSAYQTAKTAYKQGMVNDIFGLAKGWWGGG